MSRANRLRVRAAAIAAAAALACVVTGAPAQAAGAPASAGASPPAGAPATSGAPTSGRPAATAPITTGTLPPVRVGSAIVGAPTDRVAWTARIVAIAEVRAAPDVKSKPRSRVSPAGEWNGGVVKLLVLGSAVSPDGREWLHVLLPDRPNTNTGWISDDVVALGRTAWRVVIDLHSRRGSAYDAGRLVRSWPVVIGKHATPTPRGLFAVYERVRQPDDSDLGPWALHITAHSRVLFDYGGGPGRVALHGRRFDLLADPLGSATSHGCVRMDNSIVSWLAARVDSGTPVLIR
ncbi:MAG TPA: L,D-transpeptidase [Conexibacter sp.]